MSSTSRGKRVAHIPLDKREPSSVRAVILARESDPNSPAAPLESQVLECEKFIARMGWPSSALPPFIERKSGYHNVERPALDAIERLIQQRQVDVVVLLNWERLARKEERRYAALYLARKFGVEYRFVEFALAGKLDESPMAKVYNSVLQVMGEFERIKITERTALGRLFRSYLG